MNADQAKGFLTFFLQNLENEFPTTKKVIAAIPQAQSDYKPDPKSKSARELAWHIAGADMFFMDAVLNGQFDMSGEPPAAPAQINDILGWYDGAFKERVAKLKAAPTETLTKQIQAFGVFDLPAVMYLQFMLMHMAHHRGQLSTYLRPMGGK